MTPEDSSPGARAVRVPSGGFPSDPRSLWEVLSSPRRLGLSDALRRRGRPADLLLLASVPVVLVGVFLLPAGMRRALAFSYADPTLVTAFTAHFVHFETGHLLSNLASYGLLVTVTYLLSVVCARRGRFLVVFVTALTAFPLVLSALNLAFVRPRLAIGFSGVNMALFGYLPFVLTEYLGTWTASAIGGRLSLPLFFLGSAVIALLVLPGGPLVGAVALAAIVAAVFALRAVPGTIDRTDVAAIRSAVSAPGHGELLLAGVVLLAAYPFVAFPADPSAGGAVVNVYTHQLGYALAFIASYVVFGAGAVEIE